MNRVSITEQAVRESRRSGATSGRFHTGSILPARELLDIRAGRVRIPDPQRLVHLQFRRFAGCPVCNLHLHSFLQRQSEIAAASILEVVVFHSSQQELIRYEKNLPFPVVADPDRRLYTEFGVEAAPRAILDPHAWPAIVKGIGRSLFAIARHGEPIPPLNPSGGRLGLPADFLIGNDGALVACKYGVHADDQWSVDELLALARPAI